MPISEFNKKIDGKFGVRTTCRKCEIFIRQEVYNNPKLLEKRRIYNKNYKLRNKNNPLFKLKVSLRGRLYEYCK